MSTMELSLDCADWMMKLISVILFITHVIKKFIATIINSSILNAAIGIFLVNFWSILTADHVVPGISKPRSA